MRTHIPVQPAQPPKRSLVFAGLTILAAFFLTTASLHATTQQPAPKSAASPTPIHKTAHAHKRTSTATQPAPPPQPPPAPPAPKPPNWPVNDQPTNAAVVWNSQGLRIDASNSSLSQILKDVSTATGTKVEGLASDQRIFGTYGPGSARDVLAKLFEGSGYNVLMIGDQGQGTPRQIVLTTQPVGNAPPNLNNNQPQPNDDNADAAEEQPQQPQQPPNIRNGFAPGAPPRSPQQIMQEMQQRQLQQNGAQPQ